MCPTCKKDEAYCICELPYVSMTEYRCGDCGAVRFFKYDGVYKDCPECKGQMSPEFRDVLGPEDLIDPVWAVKTAMAIVHQANIDHKRSVLYCKCGHVGFDHYFESLGGDKHPAGCSSCDRVFDDTEKSKRCKGYTFDSSR